ncbi:MAG: DUF2975 domain-containing protein [Vicingaceae bacterium]
MKNLNSINILYWISNIAIGLFALLLIIILIMNAAIIADVGIDNKVFTMELPVEVGGDKGTYTSNEKVHSVILTEAVGKVGIENAPKSMLYLGLTALLAFMLIGLRFSWIFRKFMINVRLGEIFILQNMKHLRQMSYLIVLYWLLRLTYHKIIFHLYVGRIAFEHVKFNNDFDYQFTMLIPALFLFVLSHIFVKGITMDEELKLTV